MDLVCGPYKDRAYIRANDQFIQASGRECPFVAGKMPPLASADDNPRIYHLTDQENRLVYLGIQWVPRSSPWEPDRW